MIRFGIIGTNFITKLMIEAGEHLEGFKVQGVYSRTEERAKEFAQTYNAPLTFTSVKDMVESDEVDAVYVASPNSFHAEQAILAMEHGKHILCEKPMASNEKEVRRMTEAAKDNNVVLMEAVKSTLMPSFLSIQSNLHKIGKVRRYVGNFCKYSSRYDAYRQGTVLNAFNPKFSNGSLMDLGVYGIYPMVVLFGKPDRIQANGVALESGVDGKGSIIAQYKEMEAVIMHSKISHSHAASEIQGEEGVIIIPNISEPKDVYIQYNSGEVESLDLPDQYPPMYYEIEEFYKQVKDHDRPSCNNSNENSLLVAEVLQEARSQMGISFPADH
ncbi:putative oxidoreductase YulF [Halobacillus andaensis]|uniref:Oxidoreductase YulF n=1 Tax=Halobacillus andaensis TaxID=1176239 RepID=A0A917B3U2_HALAA|nr:Gfo/Idh/MocA family oxidoreductase [Halobacillus andaensis]MBP2004655.1 putative dehydrogenase [Halobacillus andaensis]GGF19949.1 putative oxidoreductase YulF [Halobacillus andaensis]